MKIIVNDADRVLGFLLIFGFLAGIFLGFSGNLGIIVSFIVIYGFLFTFIALNIEDDEDYCKI